ncbi:TylF/MycF/NovP-related O-methyltransferase [Neosynechococcus sphagnicola]|uniref:TylF/MycF/NovP-related O-methyltransferase n=1 Tax=Neosynechococcus sphagnicola TaxID=1501145 RepID=UPI000A73D10B|nr:TylF/MycF/NovP-related O-methyltransferase [Neosynechococcus sphagnicola]
MRDLKSLIKNIARKIGFNITRYNLDLSLSYPDFDRDSIDIIQNVKSHTMTSPERIYALIQAVRYIHQKNISGSIVECGVWRGGSMMAVAYTLKTLNDCTRELFLYDTFEGMSTPTSKDVDINGYHAKSLLEQSNKKHSDSVWCIATLEEVSQALRQTLYPERLVKLVKGKVEDSIPRNIPERISLLRLDTDWYESTLHELTHLYPRLAQGGVLIIDDYGHWRGCRKAVDEYFESTKQNILLNRIDGTGRIGIKV